MQTKFFLFSLLILLLNVVQAQDTMPTFRHTAGQGSYTVLGHDPAQGGTTTIPTVLVPVTLSFEARKAFVMDAAPDVPHVLRSPVFSKFPFESGRPAQYADAMLRATFPQAQNWHTLLDKPQIKPLKIDVPVGYGYILESRKDNTAFAIADVEFVQKELFRQLPRQPGKLVIAVTHNTAFYALGDATVCCSWGTHGVDSGTGNSFVLGSYLHAAPSIVEDRDVQPLTQQLAEFVNDPLHDPLVHGRNVKGPGNVFPAWMRPQGGACGGTAAGSTYFLLEPTNTNLKNNFPASKAFVAHANGAAYHLQNSALLGWYSGGSGALSFPDPQALTQPAKPCPDRRNGYGATKPTASPVPTTDISNGHQLIGYWGRLRRGGFHLPSS